MTWKWVILMLRKNKNQSLRHRVARVLNDILTIIKDDPVIFE
jgi:hypothetical protein